MGTISLNVEGSFGVRVKVGDLVETGTQIGLCIEGAKPVTSPVAGEVMEVKFCGQEHKFVVVIEEKKQQKCGN
jgi:Na+-translocating ferredoxin:NAD+ oxidoreductase RnfC subunit